MKRTDEVLPETEARLAESVRRLSEVLLQGDRRIVFAESCTAGLVAASLARTPGISERLCGSFVTYRNPTKTAWLGIPPADLDRYTSVSGQVTAAMAEGALRNTPEADFAVAVTGHLGPEAPADRDGSLFIAAVSRGPSGAKRSDRHLQLSAPHRRGRQVEAAACVLEFARSVLQGVYS